MAWRLASGPQRTPGTDMVQNFSPKAYHPAVQARVSQLDRAHPVRRIHLAAYHRAKACARHAIGANHHWLGRPFRGQPMPIPLSYLDFVAPSRSPSTRILLRGHLNGEMRGNSTVPRCDCTGYPVRRCEWPLPEIRFGGRLLVKRVCDSIPDAHLSHQRFTSVVLAVIMRCGPRPSPSVAGVCVCVWRLPSLMKSFNLREPPVQFETKSPNLPPYPVPQILLYGNGFSGEPGEVAICNSGRLAIVGKAAFIRSRRRVV